MLGVLTIKCDRHTQEVALVKLPTLWKHVIKFSPCAFSLFPLTLISLCSFLSSFTHWFVLIFVSARLFLLFITLNSRLFSFLCLLYSLVLLLLSPFVFQTFIQASHNRQLQFRVLLRETTTSADQTTNPAVSGWPTASPHLLSLHFIKLRECDHNTISPTPHTAQ